MELETGKGEWEKETSRIRQELKDNASLFAQYSQVKDNLRDERPEGKKETPGEMLARKERNIKKEAYFQEMEAKFPHTLSFAKSFIFALDLLKGKPEQKEFVIRLYLHGMKEPNKDNGFNHFGRLLENRVQGWKEIDDREVFARFAALKHEDTGKRYAGWRRISKFCDSFVGLRTMNPGKSVCQMVEDAHTVEVAVKKIEDAVNPKRGNQPFSLEYKEDCRAILGRIYTFVHFGKTNFKFAPVEIKELLERDERMGERDTTQKDALKRDEVRTIIRNTPSICDRCWMFVIFDTGCRIGEIEFVKYKDLKSTGEGYKMDVIGKTGKRTVWCRESAPYISRWLNEHPTRKKNGEVDPEAYLFVSEKTRKRLDQAAMRDRFKRVVKSIPEFQNRRIFPHMMRRGRTSELIKSGMSELMIDTVMGWKLGSKTVRRYAVVDEDTISDALAATYLDGKPQKETKIETRRPCPNCKKMLEMTDKYCSCGQMMDAEAMPPSVIAKESMEAMIMKQNEMMELQNRKMEQLQRKIARLTSMDIEDAARKGKR